MPHNQRYIQPHLPRLNSITQDKLFNQYYTYIRGPNLETEVTFNDQATFTFLVIYALPSTGERSPQRSVTPFPCNFRLLTVWVPLKPDTLKPYEKLKSTVCRKHTMDSLSCVQRGSIECRFMRLVPNFSRGYLSISS